jgi:hypothetical protein
MCTDFFVMDRKQGEIVEVTTEDRRCTIVITDPQNREVVVVSDKIGPREPEIFLLQGSVVGNNPNVKEGWISIGSRIRLKSGQGFAVLPPTISLRFVDDPERAAELMEQAGAVCPQEAASVAPTA